MAMKTFKVTWTSEEGASQKVRFVVNGTQVGNDISVISTQNTMNQVLDVQNGDAVSAVVILTNNSGITSGASNSITVANANPPIDPNPTLTQLD